jgi:hypothetical protein
MLYICIFGNKFDLKQATSVFSYLHLHYMIKLTGQGHGWQKIESEFSVRLRVLDGLVLLQGLDGVMVHVVVFERPGKN